MTNIDAMDDIIDRLYRGQEADTARWQWSYIRHDDEGVRRHVREDMSPAVIDYFKNYLGL